MHEFWLNSTVRVPLGEIKTPDKESKTENIKRDILANQSSMSSNGHLQHNLLKAWPSLEGMGGVSLPAPSPVQCAVFIKPDQGSSSPSITNSHQ